MKEFDTSSETMVDRFAMDLQQLREAKGTSYTDLTVQVSELRMARGLHEAAARTPRSTVYNCFRTGRARIDIDLLRDIVQTLTGDEVEAEKWVSRYLEARKQSERLRREDATALPVLPPAHQTPPRTLAKLRPARLSWGTVVLVMLTAVLINRLGMALNVHYSFGLFLDMIGTCIAAIILGPWYGVTVAIAYQGVALFSYFDLGALFGLVNITGALVWGYGVRHFKMGRDLSSFTLLGIITALVCSAVGVPINMFLHILSTGPYSPFQSTESINVAFAAALFSTNITTSIIDKLLAGFITLISFVFLHRRYSFPAAHMPLVEHLGVLRVAGKLRTAPAMT